MRLHLRSLLVGVAVSACVFGVLYFRVLRAHPGLTNTKSLASSDMDNNGFILSGYSTSVSDADPGKCPAGAYGLANSYLEMLTISSDLPKKLGMRVEPITDSSDVKELRRAILELHVSLIPTLGGNRFEILSSTRLSDEEKRRLIGLANVEIEKAVNEWNAHTASNKAWIP